ncbi:MAG: putative secreted protein [Methylophagaceae bacterium]|jgi:predicted secreted protein
MLKLCQLMISALLLVISPYANAAQEQQFNQINLQTNAVDNITNDQLIAILVVQESGDDPAALANSVNIKMAEIITKANEYTHIKYQTINYNSRAIYKDGAIKSWQVSQNIHLKSQDFEQLSKFISQANTLSTVESMSFSVSDQQIEKTQDLLTEQAITKFRYKAAMITKQFGKSNYHLVHVNIGHNTLQPQRSMMRSLMAKQSMADAAPNLSAGTNKISVNINGTIQLY